MSKVRGRAWKGTGTWPASGTSRASASTASEAIVAGWDRERMLPRLIAVGPDELADRSRNGRLVIVRRIIAALRGERTRGRAGHWSYSLDRHIGLVQALAAERCGLPLADRERIAPAPGSPPHRIDPAADGRNEDRRGR